MDSNHLTHSLFNFRHLSWLARQWAENLKPTKFIFQSGTIRNLFDGNLSLEIP